MKIGLLCGEKSVDLNIPERVALLEMESVEALSNPQGAVQEALSNPIESPPLKELAQGKKNVCIVISDITRPVPNRIILPPMLQILQESGIGKENTTILIATGMHRPNLGEELASVVGRDIMDNYTIVNHYCREPEAYRKIDEIDGAPIEINRRYLDADLKILTGLIEPHFYAGYSGGRKSILPGISSFETMKFMHSYAMIDHPNVTNCLLEGNPFHEYGLQVTELAGADFILNVVINKERRIAGVFAGHYNHAHVAGCRMVYGHSAVELEQRVDMVITSGGGYPLDATFYQMSKAFIGSKNILKKGGTIVLVCECREGMGSPEFSGIMCSGAGRKAFIETYCDPKNFVIDQWCAQNIYQALDHAGRVYVHSPGLSHDDLKTMGVIKVEDVQETVNALLRNHENVVAVPDGPYVVGIV
ncbi:MAG: nickel-dependent lactate racemase [Deltaproteobacteria bacterium]|nr:nickel-dependent lactate racemase [Deltaproteobacteria bacterium]